MTALQQAIAEPTAPEPEPTSSWRDRLPPWVTENPGPLIALLGALCWVIGFRPINPAALGAFGILPSLSPTLLLSYPLLVIGFVLELRRGRGWALTAITIVTVFAVYGLQPLAEPEARLPVAWLHVGFADYINAHGAVLPDFDARFSWPGFFALLAMVTGASGMKDSSALIAFAPVFISGIATLSVRSIAQAVFGEGRLAWIAAWIFLIGNWTEEDYLSPQGSTYLLLLAALAVTIKFLVRPGVIEPLERGQFLRPAVPENSPKARLWAQGVVLLLGIAMAPSHQLSPFVLAGLLIVLALTGRLWSRWLPVAVFGAALVWFVLGAKDFWVSQLNEIIGGIGDVDSSVDQGLAQRLSSNFGRETILVLRIGITCATGLMAGLGAIVLRRQQKKALTLVLFAVTAFGLAVAQPYGGEILIRCYLFALPIFALLGAVLLEMLLHNNTIVKTWLRRAGLVVGTAVIAGLVLSLVIARGGNDAYVAFTKADLAGVEKAYQLAQKGDTLDTVTSYAPIIEWQRLGDVEQGAVEGTTCIPYPKAFQCVEKVRPDLLLVNAAQDEYGQIYYGMDVGWIYQMADQLVNSGDYRRVFDQGTSEVLELSSDVNR
ncbi:MAG TPA: hypothetical protein VHW44_24110 [Pseudonocardiaceae bacterium]|jgi:hypothetical protein|nr:hypothetical protein [Pseudonocardiaceae bacterium]